MSIYDINFNQKAIELAPPDKRRPIFVKWVQSLLSQNTILHKKIFIDYKTGASYPNYNPALTYAQGVLVIYGETVYESLENSNAAVPTDPTKWKVYQDSFIGTNERITYNHVKLSLEYALNRRFQTTFNQPPTLSDIYIVTNAKPFGPFIVGADEPISSSSYSTTSSDFVINAYSFGTLFYNFTVYVPLAVYNGVSATPSARENIFRTFIDQYNTIGINYNIQTY
jgi:hypothetical protein